MALVTKAPTPEYTEKSDDVFGELVPFAEPSWYHGYVSPYYKDSHKKLREALRTYIDSNLMSEVGQWDEDKLVPPEVYKDFGSSGMIAASIYPLAPKEYFDGLTLPGGVPYEEWDAFHDFIFNDELARVGAIGVCMSLCGGNQIGLPPVIKYAAPHLQKEVVTPVLKGDKRICLAITEPDAGSDVAGLTTTAKLTEDGKHYIINGQKKWITTALWSDYLTTAVRTGGPGAKGISVILIPANLEGIEMRRMHTGGARCSGSTLVTFDDVKVPVENLLGKEGEGFKVIMQNFNHERMMVSFIAHRSARVCLEDSITHVQGRIAFGAPLLNLGTIRAKLSEMARRIEAQHHLLESLVYQSTVLPKTVLDAKLGGLTALAKANGTQCLEFCTSEAVNCFGGLGTTVGGRGARVERLYRDAKIASIPGGTTEVMLDLAIRQQIKVAEALQKQRERREKL